MFENLFSYGCVTFLGSRRGLIISILLFFFHIFLHALEKSQYAEKWLLPNFKNYNIFVFYLMHNHIDAFSSRHQKEEHELFYKYVLISAGFAERRKKNKQDYDFVITACFGEAFSFMIFLSLVNCVSTRIDFWLHTEASLFVKIQDQKTIYISINWMSASLLNKLETRIMPIISFHLKIPSTFDNTNIFNFIKSRMAMVTHSIALLFFVYLRYFVSPTINSFNCKWFEGKWIISSPQERV